MNLIQLAGIASKLGINVNLAAIGNILPLLNKKAQEITSDDVVNLGNLLGLNVQPDSDAVSNVVDLVQNSNFDRVSDLLSSEADIVKAAHMLMYNQERLSEKLARDIPTIPVKCECGVVGEIDRAGALRQTKADGFVTYICLTCDKVKEISAKSIRTFGL